MTQISTGWVVVTYACLILTTLCMCGMLAGLFYAMKRGERMLSLMSHTGLPKAYALTDSATQVVARMERILQKIDGESDTAVAKVEQALERVEGALEHVEHTSEKLHYTVQGTAQGIHDIKHDPRTKQILVGAGALAAAGYAKSVYDHFKGNGNGKNGSGRHKH